MAKKRIGYWLSEKKSKKLSLSEIEDALTARNIEAVKIDITKPLSLQGPFDLILHKLTDFIAKASFGCEEAQIILNNFKQYVQEENPKCIVIDPIDCLSTLIDRYKTYTIIQNCELKHYDNIFVPPYVTLECNNIEENIRLIRMANVKFPLVSKPIIAHGSFSAHQVRDFENGLGICLPRNRNMTLVFNEKGLAECNFPTVVQSFVNHNAILYKLFALGEKYYLVERPSIKNLFASNDIESIHFDSDISKPHSSSQLTQQEEKDKIQKESKFELCPIILSKIVKEIHQAFNLGLFGVDVVVECTTGRYAIFDINAFPGYDGVDSFGEVLAEYIKSELDRRDKLIEVKMISNGSNGTTIKPSRLNKTSVS